MTGAAPAQCQPAARSTKQCWPRSGYRVRQAHPGCGGSPNPDSPARAAQSVHEHQRRLRACRAADADTSTGARAATGANDEPSPASRTRCATAHGEASEPARPGTPDQPGGSSADPPAGEALRARDAKRVSRPPSRRQIDTAPPSIRGVLQIVIFVANPHNMLAVVCLAALDIRSSERCSSSQLRRRTLLDRRLPRPGVCVL
jgi:hypothetical protein